MNPDRLVIDVEGLELNPICASWWAVRADDPFIAGVRVGQNRPDRRAPRAGPEAARGAEIFSLAPVSTYQHRLVFDLYPVENDPVALRWCVPARSRCQRLRSGCTMAAASSASQPGTNDQAACHERWLGDLIGKIPRQQAPAAAQPARPAPAASAEAGPAAPPLEAG